MDWLRYHLRLFVFFLIAGAVSSGVVLYFSGYKPVVNFFRAAEGIFDADHFINSRTTNIDAAHFVICSTSGNLYTPNVGQTYFYNASATNTTGIKAYVRLNQAHRPEAICDPANGGTGSDPGGVATLTGKTVFLNNESGEFRYDINNLSKWNCGRVQVDAFVSDASSGAGTNRIGLFGVVFKYNKDCAATSTPTPLPLKVTCSANPASAPAPYPSTGNITATVTGRGNDSVKYRVDCTNNGSFENETAFLPQDSYSWNICNSAYAAQGSYTARVRVTSQDGNISDVNNCTVTVTSPTPTPTPTPTATVLTCSPANQTVAPEQAVNFTASGGSGGAVKTFVWGALGGSPATQSGTSNTFSTTYSIPGSKVVTVSSGVQTAVCRVTVSSVAQPLVCSPVLQTVQSGQTASLTASGGSGSYAWSGGGNPATGTGVIFTTVFTNSSPIAAQHSVTLKSGTLTKTCVVNVTRVGTPTPTPTDMLTPTPTPTPTLGNNPVITIEKMAKNISSGGAEGDNVSASPNDVIEFSIKVTSSGNAIATDVTVTDVLPSNMTYIDGSATVDGSGIPDGITTSGVLLGNMPAGTSKAIRFRALIAGPSAFAQGNTSLVDNAIAVSTNSGTVTDSASVNVTITVPGGATLTIQKLGRNSSRGEATANSSVTAYSGNTLEFTINIRNNSSGILASVKVRDVLPNHLSYVNNSTSLNGVGVADGITTASGINIGNLSPSQESVVKFFVTVAPASSLPAGQTYLLNVVYVSANDVPEIRADLPITVVNGGGASQVPTGPADTLWLSLFTSGFVTFMYMLYTRTTFFKKHEIEGLIEEQSKDKEKFNFEK